MKSAVVIGFFVACVSSACGSDFAETPGAQPEETRGGLDPNRCPGTFAECDGDARTICETDLISSRLHCGACGNACAEGLHCSKRGCIAAGEIAQVIAFSYSTCVRLGAGDVYCWGLNDSGQLGDGTRDNRDTATRSHVADAAELFAIGRSVCARTRDGSARCWGDIAFVEMPEPRSVSTTRPFTVLDPGGKAACGILTNGDVVCWGHDDCGAFGDGSPGSGFVSDPMPSLARDAVAISTGSAGCIAERAGTVSCWGFWRGLGDGTLGTEVTLDAASCEGGGQGVRGTPGLVPGISDAVSVVKARRGNCVVHASGKLSCWGDIDRDDGFASIDPGAPPPRLQRPTALEGVSDVFKLAPFGNYHACALHRNGRVSCWGASKYYERENLEAWDPVLVPGIDDAVDISIGSEHSCVLRRAGEVLCWGDNRYGQLGDRTKTFSRRPVRAVIEQ